MIPAPFEYHRPATLEDAVALLGRFGDAAKVLAGGQSLIPLMKLRLTSPRHVVDLNRVPGLGTIAEPRFLVLVGKGGAPLGRGDGVREYTMTCHSGGTLEIFVDPVLPKAALVLVGSGPVVETLADLAAAARFAVTVVEPESPGPARLREARVVADLAAVAVTSRTAIVVATHGRFDEDALEQALRSEADYVSLVASPTRARVVLESLRARAIPDDRLRRLKAPAGLDLGAVTPEEIAVSILAEIVARRRRPHPAAPPDPAAPAAAPAVARDPVCGMTVTIATARHRSEAASGPVYFCCAGCKRQFDLAPARYEPADRGWCPGQTTRLRRAARAGARHRR